MLSQMPHSEDAAGLMLPDATKNAQAPPDARSPLEAILGMALSSSDKPGSSDPESDVGVPLLEVTMQQQQQQQHEPAAAQVPAPAPQAEDRFTIQYTEKEKRERRYECGYCKKRFQRPSSLTSHVYTHTGERPFACTFPGCSRRFSVHSNLRRHHKVHTKRRRSSREERAHGPPLACPLFPGRRPGIDAVLAHPPRNPLLPIAHAGGSGSVGAFGGGLAGQATATAGWGALAPGTAGLMASQCRSTYPGPLAGGYAPRHQLEYLDPPPPPPPGIESIIGGAISQELGALSLPLSLAPAGSAASSNSSPGSGHSLSLADTALAGGFGPRGAPGGLGSAFTDSQVEALLGSAAAIYAADSDASSNTSTSSDCAATATASSGSSSAQAAAVGPLFLGSSSSSSSSPLSLPLPLPLPPPLRAVPGPELGALAGAPAIATPPILTNSSTTTKAMTGAIESSRPSGSGSDAAALFDALYGGGGCNGGGGDHAAAAVWQLLQAGRPQR
ncbi:hypothetical protein H4R18_003258 [Coemansia javaensis]|uniref:C2H2-type domain-containing protein n=1 Tax=Coemansia javaensis TaxID=2761396 RepID=A0A9W8HCM9_9FUNG|nr:hypothetical protein H4R18_003258 [Coemansia javaensis]